MNKEAGCDPGLLREIACRFTGMILPGTTIRVQLLNREEAGDGTRLGFRVLNEEGRAAIGDGFARIA